jgi:SAM-dependent methyltransferase
VLHAVFVLLAAATATPAAGAADAQTACAERYDSGPSLGRQGTGRFHLGREIAPVMGHHGAGWLERPEREAEERGSLAIARLGLRSTDVVADFGAGSGWYTVRMARLVSKGRVIAVDVQPEMLALVKAQAARAKLANIETVLATEDDPKLAPSSLDLLLMVDVYHELSRPCEVIRGIARALKPGGRLALIEFRGEDPAVPIQPLHKMTRAQVDREMAAAGFAPLPSFDGLPWQHLLFYEKR